MSMRAMMKIGKSRVGMRANTIRLRNYIDVIIREMFWTKLKKRQRKESFAKMMKSRMF
jgi:hypothetical protein